MNRALFIALALVAAAPVSALAADLPPPAYKAPPPPPPAVSWTGCYIDGGVGYGMSNTDHNLETFPGLAAVSSTTTNGGRGWLGRAGGGCDYQFSAFNNWNAVIGALGEYDFSNIHGTYDDPVNGLGGNNNQSSAWYVGGRAGVLVTPTLLTYFDGGYTQARFDQINLSAVSATPAVVSPFSLGPNTLHGWFIGGGTEYAFTWLPIPGLFWRNEYRYSSYQSADVPAFVTATTGPTGFAQHAQTQVQTITTSLVWRFNWIGY